MSNRNNTDKLHVIVRFNCPHALWEKISRIRRAEKKKMSDMIVELLKEAVNKKPQQHEKIDA